LLTCAAALGMMALTGAQVSHMNLFTLSLVLGLGVDAWIHLAGRLAERGGSAGAVAAAVRDAGPALICTCGLLVAGFLALLASRLPSIRTIGAVLAWAAVVNLVATLVWWAVAARWVLETTGRVE
jgi:predicted RND superfamily exporter protein